jgi:hypothetical protein
LNLNHYDSNFVTDPYSYSYWTHDPLFAYISGLSKMTGKPDPKDGSPVWVEIETYAPSACQILLIKDLGSKLTC